MTDENIEKTNSHFEPYANIEADNTHKCSKLEFHMFLPGADKHRLQEVSSMLAQLDIEGLEFAYFIEKVKQ